MPYRRRDSVRRRRRREKTIILCSVAALLLAIPLGHVVLRNAARWGRQASDSFSAISPVAVASDFAAANALSSDENLDVVLAQLQDRQFPARRQLLDLVIRGNVAKAVPVLEGIVNNADEDTAFRAAALLGLNRLDEKKAQRLAKRYESGPSDLRRAARQISNGNPN